jgi:tetratricopeptide (TPR) repeat protein
MGMDMGSAQPRRRKRAAQATARSLNLPRWGLAAALAVLGGWLAFTVSVAAIARADNPDLSASIARFDAVATGERAYQLIESDNSPANRVTAGALAKRALSRDPTAIAAVRTLGLIADQDGRSSDAARAFHYSEQLSRRDFATQLWFINAMVARDDAAGALAHFDKALRTSDLARPILMPILVAATEDARLIAPIAAQLSRRPPWRDAYVAALIETGKAMPEVTDLIERVGNAQERRDMAARDASAGRYDLALKLYQRAGGAIGKPVSGFAGAGDFVPFDWELINVGAVATNLVDAGSDSALEFSVNTGQGGDIARRLTTLKPGRYQLASAVKMDRADASSRLLWQVSCAGQPNMLAELAIDAKKPQQEIDLTVPASGCAVQWLRLILPNNDSGGVVGGRLEAISIRAL